MRTPIAAVLTCGLTLALAPAWGQTLQFNFDAIAAKAREKVQVDLSGDLLKAAMQFVQAENDGDDAAKLQALAANITDVTVRSYEFAQSGAYADSDLDGFRAQLTSAAGWSRIIDAKEDDEHSEIYTMIQNGRIAGLVVIAAESNELTVVHLRGMIDPAQLASVQELVQSHINFDMAAVTRR